MIWLFFWKKKRCFSLEYLLLFFPKIQHILLRNKWINLIQDGVSKQSNRAIPGGLGKFGLIHHFMASQPKRTKTHYSALGRNDVIHIWFSSYLLCLHRLSDCFSWLLKAKFLSNQPQLRDPLALHSRWSFPEIPLPCECFLFCNSPRTSSPSPLHLMPT